MYAIFDASRKSGRWRNSCEATMTLFVTFLFCRFFSVGFGVGGIIFSGFFAEIKIKFECGVRFITLDWSDSGNLRNTLSLF